MSVIAILILISLTVALIFLAGFIWAVRSGQFEDTFTPSLRVLTDDASSAGGGLSAGPTKPKNNEQCEPGERQPPSGISAAPANRQINQPTIKRTNRH